MRITNQPCDSVSAPPSFSVARPSNTDVNDFFLQVCFAEKEDDKHQIEFFSLFFSPFSIGSRHFPDFFSLDF